MSGSTGIVVTPAAAAGIGLSNIASAVVQKNKKVTMASLSVPGQGQGHADAKEKKSRRPLGSVRATAATSNISGNKKKKKKGARKDEANFPIPLAFLYRDPRPAAVRRVKKNQQQQLTDSGELDWDALEDGMDGLIIKETAEQRREKKTLFAANMGQAQAFESRFRYHDADAAFTKALELQPGDKNALCSRSRCRLQMGDTKGALADAEEALAGDSLYVKATYQKAEVLYQMGRFEEALVFYHKGVQQRPDMDLFHQGIRKSQEAIEVSLGVKKPTMTQLQQVRSTVTNRKKKSSYRHLGKSNSLLSSNGFTSGPNKRESSLLGDLHVDKLYLENLLLNPGLRNTSVPSSQKIIQHAKDTLEYLKARENFWRQQQPVKIVYPASIKERSSGRSKIIKRSRRIVSSQINLTSPEESEREQQRTDDGRTDTSNSEGAASHLEECSTSDSNRSRNSANQEEYDEQVDCEPTIEEYNDGHYLDSLRQITEEMMNYNENNQLNRCVHVYTSKCISINSLQDDDSKEQNLNREIEIKLNRIETAIDNKTHLVVDIGTLYLAIGKEEESMKWAKKALLWSEASGDVCATTRSLLLLAALAALSGESDKVTAHLSRAHKILLDDLLMLQEEEEDGEQQQQQSLLITGKHEDFSASLEHTDEEEPTVIDAQ